MDSEIECILGKFADDSSCVEQSTHWREGMPSRGTKTEWACANLMKFNKVKCKALHLARAIPSTNTGWVENVLRAALMRRTWGCW